MAHNHNSCKEVIPSIYICCQVNQVDHGMWWLAVMQCLRVCIWCLFLSICRVSHNCYIILLRKNTDIYHSKEMQERAIKHIGKSSLGLSTWHQDTLLKNQFGRKKNMCPTNSFLYCTQTCKQSSTKSRGTNNRTYPLYCWESITPN